ncbi:hypothetical protein JHW43_003432 [Diplocarpon mali]|nr:hypothetical protein JHW43_003432 [Diplocarpon mali]
MSPNHAAPGLCFLMEACCRNGTLEQARSCFAQPAFCPAPLPETVHEVLLIQGPVCPGSAPSGSPPGGRRRDKSTNRGDDSAKRELEPQTWGVLGGEFPRDMTVRCSCMRLPRLQRYCARRSRYQADDKEKRRAGAVSQGHPEKASLGTGGCSGVANDGANEPK